MEQVILNLEDTIQAIECDPNYSRIKKLMAYACSQVWNNRSSEPNPLDALILQLLRQYPTAEDLQAQLYHLVGTLNKTAEYTLVANTILGYLASIYAQQQPIDETTWLDYPQVAQQLQQDPDALRIKKLLYCACGHSWQNDPAILEGVDMVSLVHQMRHVAPTQSTLSAILASIVATLNRAQTYDAIAHRIAIAFTPLYDDADDAAETEMTEIDVVAPDATGLLPPAHDASIETAISRPEGAIASACSSSQSLTLATLAKSLPRVQLSMVDLYDLRLEVMKYTTPLRAKVLLFAALRQQMTWSSEDYTLLKTTDLSALLQETFQTYKYIDHLRPHLTDVANRLTPTPDYLQACSAILRAVTPWYETGIPEDQAVDISAQTVPDLNTSPQREATDMQFSQGEVTGTLNYSIGKEHQR